MASDGGAVMAARRFEVKELSMTRKFEGTITVADLRRAFKIPAKAEITVRVPGGGDWSGQDLNLADDVERGIVVRWEEVK